MNAPPTPYRPPRRRRDKTRLAVSASIVGVLVAALLAWLVVSFAAENPDKVKLGDDRFVVGDAKRLARHIRDDGPFLFKDPLTSRPGREVYVQHTGPDPEKGWIAIEAYGAAPGSSRELRCILQWDEDRRAFRDPCGGETCPADGEGLRTYPAKVNGDGDVEVNLRTAP